ncbi:MAG: phosphomannomutase/phosphoglucomutase [Patescibacteria group bacterium]|nr:phosphomannomutase/phosphoglucomutase [Patescibacteria group bacterium]MDD5294436.1 phosphomannomutase/phosphoglucomutase [Patescibacteria group bacterium]MDD5554110.1 phosphomannomutase/phosphoglucomutase [Patescibacteria group bacterium]
MALNPKIFKSYDIRGIYPDELDEETAFKIGQAYAQITKAETILVGRDMRIGSPELSKAVIEGVLSQGVNVYDTGMISCDGVYFGVGKTYDAGVYITASHNPKEYNGMKFPIHGSSGMKWLRGAELYEFMRDKTFAVASGKGKLIERDITPEYIEHVLSFADLKKIRPLKIVIDAGNGMAGKIAPLLFKKLPGEIIPLNFTLDGTFPGHPSNPLLPESQVEISKKVVETRADFGIIMDGDTDRLFFVTEKGDFIRADVTLILLAKHFLKHNPGVGIAYNLICSRAVRERIAEWGGRPLRAAVGYVNVAEAMRNGQGIMSGEVSAHYAFRDNYYADSGFIALMILISLISEENRKLSDIMEGLNPYFRLDEINFKTDKMQEIIAAAREKFKDGQQNELDGLTVEYKDWWLNIRPSNTEPLLRITIEAETKEIAAEKEKEVRKFLEENL